MKATTPYNTLKRIAKEHSEVEEFPINNGSRGYTVHSREGQKIVVMKIPGEDVNVLHTLILEHLYRNDISRGLAGASLDTQTRSGKDLPKLFYEQDLPRTIGLERQSCDSKTHFQKLITSFLCCIVQI
ncbi:MAG: hypothetical protein RE469_01135 [Cuniculiplasma divulgatum]|nr:MAG: hypothetical protein RE469_01135 [Cuniculiplasma divulgatum]